MTVKIGLLTALLLFLSGHVQAQIKIDLQCNNSDWNYKTGDEVVFSYQITDSGRVLSHVDLEYQIGEEKMKASQTGRINKASGKLNGGSMNKPGFLRCTISGKVNGKSYKGLATAAFETEKIQPTIPFPADFQSFWSKAIQDVKSVPLDPKLTEIKEMSTEKVKVYAVSFQNEKVGSRIYGMLTVPTKDGKFPAILDVPGAGIRAHKPDLEFSDSDIITLQIGIHGIPVQLEDHVYTNLASGALRDYPFINLDSKDHYYYRRVYLGCIKAIDFIFNMPEFDQTNIAVSGGSQGGALAIVTAALDPRIKYLRCHYPALCDQTGYLHARAGGWPHLLNAGNLDRNHTDKKLETISYYDVANFARLVQQPGFYSWGYNDEVCPPTSMYAAYNVITAPKELFLVKETGHQTTAIQVKKRNQWLSKKLKSN